MGQTSTQKSQKKNKSDLQKIREEKKANREKNKKQIIFLVSIIIISSITGIGSLSGVPQKNLRENKSNTATFIYFAPKPQTLEGELTVHTTDDLERNKESHVYILKTKNGTTYDVSSSRGLSEKLQGGKVQIKSAIIQTGNKVEGEIKALALPQPPAKVTERPKRIALISVYFPNTTPLNTSRIQNLYFGENKTTADSAIPYSTKNFIEEVSFKKASITGVTFGPYLLKTTPESQNTCIEIIDTAISIARKNIYYPYFDEVGIIMPTVNCGFHGGATMRNIQIGTNPNTYHSVRVHLINGLLLNGDPTDLHITSHEIIHNYGIGHAKRLECPGNDLENWDPLGTSCINDARNPYDGMGYIYSTSTYKGPGHPNIVLKKELSWILDSKIQNVYESDEYTISPLELGTTPNPQGLRIRLPYKTIYKINEEETIELDLDLVVEYRQPIGIDRILKNTEGALVEIHQPFAPAESHLFKTNSKTLTVSENPFLIKIGETYRDEKGKISITPLGKTKTGDLRIKIQIGDLPFPIKEYPEISL